MLEAHVAAALVNSTWQSAMVALVAFVALRTFKRTSAAARCAVWYGVLAIVALLPVVDVATSLSAHAVAAPQALANGAVRPSGARAPMRSADPGVFLVVSEPPVAERIAVAIGSVAPWIERAWLAVALALGLQLLYEMVRLVAAKRRVVPLGRVVAVPPGTRTFRVGASEDVETPCVLGLFDPIVVLPRALAHALSEEDLARVVLHEAAHVERRDDWIHLIERALHVAFFFNPIVYAIGRRLEVEREIACDDLAVARCGNRLAYASCLSSLAVVLSTARRAPTPALFSGRRQLIVRVERLLDAGHDGSTRTGPRAAVALAAIVAVAFVVAHFGIPVRAQLARVAMPRTPALPAPVAPRIRESFPLPPTVRTQRLPVRHLRPRAPLAPVPSLARSIGDVILLRKHDVSAKFVADVDSALEAKASTVALVALRDHDVTPAYLAQLKIAGVTSKCGFDFVRLHDHGVTPLVVAKLQRRLGTMKLSVDRLVRMADAGT
jgi:beta-lactamase regulating signal transducer with metallopeptidase domain